MVTILAKGTEPRRELAEKLIVETEKLERIGVRYASAITLDMIVAALRAYRQDGNVIGAIQGHAKNFELVLIDAMTAAHLHGLERSALAMEEAVMHWSLSLTSYDSSIAFMRKRLRLNDTQVKSIKSLYGNEAAAITRGMTQAAEKAAAKAITEIVDKNLHVSGGVALLRERLEQSGISVEKPYLLETLVRTHTQVAYAAGRMEINNDSAVADIIWGYEYFTAGDDRVRPSHEALDGTKLPKEAIEWRAIMPPNGFNCRCQVVEVFEPEKEKRPKEKKVDGILVKPEPDKGWEWAPGSIFKTTASSSVAESVLSPIARMAKIVVTGSTSEQISQLLDLLYYSTDAVEKRAIRKKLRLLGHKRALAKRD